MDITRIRVLQNDLKQLFQESRYKAIELEKLIEEAIEEDKDEDIYRFFESQ